MNNVLSEFYSVFGSVVSWFFSTMIVNSVSLGGVIIAALISSLAATYIVMKAKVVWK